LDNKAVNQTTMLSTISIYYLQQHSHLGVAPSYYWNKFRASIRTVENEVLYSFIKSYEADFINSYEALFIKIYKVDFIGIYKGDFIRLYKADFIKSYKAFHIKVYKFVYGFIKQTLYKCIKASFYKILFNFIKVFIKKKSPGTAGAFASSSINLMTLTILFTLIWRDSRAW